MTTIVKKVNDDNHLSPQSNTSASGGNRQVVGG
jgi:hypothetical protein